MLTEEKKKELFPYFAYLYSRELDPEKYGSVTSSEDWINLIQENPEDLNIITEEASKLSDEDWEALSQRYNSESDNDINESESLQLAAKGAKLKRLKDQKQSKTVADAISNPVLTQGKSGMKAKKKKKCSCGCDMLLTKKGGKVVEMCSCKCGGKMKKKTIAKAQAGTKIADSTDWKNRTFSKFNDQGLLSEKNKLTKMLGDGTSSVISLKIDMINRELNKRAAEKRKKFVPNKINSSIKE